MNGTKTNTRFPEFQKLIDTRESRGFDYKKDYQIVIDHINKRARKEPYSLSEHISGMVFSELSNQRPWKPIQENAENITRIFHNFDADALLKMSSDQLKEIVNGLKAIKCGNRQISKQVATLPDNIRTLLKIEAEYGSIDAYYNETPVDEIRKTLSSGKYKLKQMGVPLVSEYLRNVGVDIIKPDTHVKRILGRLGYTANNPATDEEAIRVCEEIAAEYGVRNVEVDAVLWQYCANSYSPVCTATPICEECKAFPCKRCPKASD